MSGELSGNLDLEGHNIIAPDGKGIIDNSTPNNELLTFHRTGSAKTHLDLSNGSTDVWVKIVDSGTQKPTWVPPDVVLSGVIAYTDKVAHEWFAPAGLNRGGLV